MTLNFNAKQIINATKYSAAGLRRLLRERAFLQEIYLLPIVIFTLFIANTHQTYLALSYVLLLITEALNTAVEITINRISKEKHNLSKDAKDVGSAAVFIAIINFIIAILLCCFC